MPRMDSPAYSQFAGAAHSASPIQPALQNTLPGYRECVLPWNEVCQKRNALFYTFCTPADQREIQVPVIPDACADILICCDAAAPELSVCTRRLDAGTLHLRTGARYFGFKPYSTKGMSLKLDEAGAEALRRAMLDQGLFERLSALDSFDAQIALFCHFAKRHLIDYSYRPDLVELAEILICQSCGNIRVETLGKALYYSPRYCRERFYNDHGTTLKNTCDILRFQNLLRLMSHNRGRTDSELASSAGYFDQSHMIHAFRHFMGDTPRRFRQMYLPSCN